MKEGMNKIRSRQAKNQSVKSNRRKQISRLCKDYENKYIVIIIILRRNMFNK
ncbi:hypothetical protein TOT_020000279 [Theileria orientalis strain Shintoku]|uniref:Uncharacterized protein n=1 Tax=Theileria orientalis strain Shintoku TaxID=869250 RepID=J4CCU7_THEOR|nr:hypothetical protein TOT_020000279 [Theileria orientalis strain Shintoku]PVC51134.1 hypothetical protein MACL_00001819 [Theileria orientalis]BAM40012.1 hypothetical protein TOT_020000279 [Theileria orientalis strain Shintoku]|eukprot:XP_009690313.1 hypothetical protein TOT_020000279 [Theileria orientalis strain Shintoku]